MTFIERTLLSEVERWAERKEVIAIRGPRQSGKTTLLKRLAEWLREERGLDEKHVVYLTLEDREVLDRLARNPKDFVKRLLSDQRRHYLLMDEAQYLPDLGQRLKLIYDLYDNVKLVVTGSSSLELKRHTGRFLVGRLLEFELLPLSFLEFLSHKDRALARVYEDLNRGLVSLLEEGSPLSVKEDEDIFAGELLPVFEEYAMFGGYPAVALAEGEDEKKLLLKGIMNTYMDRDIVSFLQITDTIKFRNLMTALAASQGGLVNLDRLSNEVGSYFGELTRLLDVLEQTYVIRRVRPFHRNLVTELKKAQKVYFVDQGMRNSLLDDFRPLDKRADAGAVVEGFVLGQLSSHARVGYWRTTAKTEVDFVARGKEITPVEVKFQRMREPEMSRSMGSFLNAYAPRDCLVATRGFWEARREGGTRVSFVPICYF